MSGLEGRVALVTGAGRGVGRSTAFELARVGARVAILARSRADLEETSARVKELGGTALVVQGDLGDLAGLPELVRQVRGRLGDVEILVNNASTPAPVGDSVSLDPAAWADALDVNVVAPVMLAFALVPAMLDRGWGRVVNLSSGVVDGPEGMLRANAYVTSKAALEAHTLNLAAELAGSGVTANVYRPGAVRTDMFAYMLDHPVGSPEMRDWAVRVDEEGELISPDVAARSLLARLSTDATGQIWDVSDEM